MTEQQLAAIEARAAAASMGDGSIGNLGWAVGVAGRANVVRSDDHNILAVAQVFRDADAEFVAHAREDVPALVAEVRRLRALLVLERAERETCSGCLHGCCPTHLAT